MKTQKIRRVFGGLIVTQERWLNEMSGKGYRLNYISGKRYDFIECEPGKYEYKIFMLKEGENTYTCVDALREQGYTAFVKSTSALSVIYLRKSRRIIGLQFGDGNTRFPKFVKDNLVIVEKISGSKDPDVRFIIADISKCVKKHRNAYFFPVIVMTIAAIISHWAFIVIDALLLIPLVRFQIELSRFKGNKNS